MKKVFLSLAALAFVATGSLTMTSCGSDDSTPVTPTPPVVDDTTPQNPQAENTVRFDGVDSPLDFSYYELIVRDYNTQGGGTIEEVTVYNFPGGGYANGYYVNVGYNMTEDGVDTYHYAFILVKNESIVIGEQGIEDFGEAVFPHQAEEEDIYWASAYVEIDGDVYASAQGNVGTGSVDVNTLVLQQNEDGDLVGTSNFVSQFSIDGSDFNFIYNGATFFDTYNNTPAAGKGVNSIKNNMLNAAKHLEVNANFVK